MFRPRYSLLTLLVLTALVAGGVKLWYGPHHVVEWNAKGDEEEEYTYTRNLAGQRIIQGPYIKRTTLQGINSQILSINYFRNNTDTNWHKLFVIDLTDKHVKTQEPYANPFDDIEQLELLPHELREYQAAIDRECAALQNEGFKIEAYVTPSKPEAWK